MVAVAVVFLEGATDKRRLLAVAHCRGRLLRRGHREAGRAAALSRGQRYAVAVVFLEGATDQRRLLVVAHCRGRLLRGGRLNGVGFLLYASLQSAFSSREGPSELELGRRLVVA